MKWTLLFRNLFICLICLLFATPVLCFQRPGYIYNENWTLCALARQSDLIVTGRVDSIEWVVDPIEKDKEFARLDSLPNIEKFLIGSLYKIDVLEVLYSKNEQTDLLAATIFAKGNHFSLHSPTPYFVKDSSYLIYLVEIGNDEIEAGAKIMTPGDLELEKIDPAKNELFVVASEFDSYHLLTDKTEGMVKKAKAYIKTRKQDCSEE